jgi:hypothetical protein
MGDLGVIFYKWSGGNSGIRRRSAASTELEHHDEWRPSLHGERHQKTLCLNGSVIHAARRRLQ